MTSPVPSGARRVLMDVTRLIRRARLPAPTGIDRVELAYATHFLAHPRHAFAGLGPFGHRLLAESDARFFIRSAADAWSEKKGMARRERMFQKLLRQLATTYPPGEWQQTFDLRAAEGLSTRWKNVERAARFAAALARGAGPSGNESQIFLHVSHMGLEHSHRFAWLRQTRTPAAFFIHDLIPLDRPEFCRPGEGEKHFRRMVTVQRHASVVIVNSESTAASLRRFFESQRWRIPAIVRIPIGVESTFVRRPASESNGGCYFVAVGTIEPRKNHLLLLHLWRRLAEELGERTPRLVIIGRRGWENENVFDLLDRSEALSGRIIEVNGLSDAEVATVLAGARALLMPSFIEGFSLPVLEALSLGVPVVASDIPVHRELGGSYLRYLDPLDAGGWRAAVMELSPVDSQSRAAMAAAIQSYRPPTWGQHFGVLEDTLAATQPREPEPAERA